MLSSPRVPKPKSEADYKEILDVLSEAMSTLCSPGLAEEVLDADKALQEVIVVIEHGLSSEQLRPELGKNLPWLIDAGDTLCLLASKDLSQYYTKYRNTLSYLNEAYFISDTTHQPIQ